MVAEHPYPTSATVKLLYARAFCCAFPDCTKPLYREDAASGTWTLNSRICHICARREGGPRWDSRQSPEENRSEGNLLLMCHKHASAIDDQKSLSVYTVSLLQQWKREQIEDHRQRMEGWPLTNAMAEQAIKASFAHVDIAINESTISLGGDGGKAPGAGGGGGGAIGRGARAGRGGDGGKHYDFGLGTFPPASPDELLRRPDFSQEQAPGAGGGAAGAIGEGAVAGNGGDGGDSASGLLAVDPGDVIEAEIGKAGLGARLPGQHGQDGDDTILRLRSSDGTLKREIRVKGGAGAKSGELPDGAREISQADLAGGFQISMLLPANSVEFRDNLLFMLGAGWAKCYVPHLPCEAIWQIVCSANWHALDAAASRWLQMCLLDPAGTEVSRIALEIPAQVLSRRNLIWIRSLGAVLGAPGPWTVRVQSGGFLLSQIEIDVELQS